MVNRREAREERVVGEVRPRGTWRFVLAWACAVPWVGCTTVELGERPPLEGAAEELIAGTYTHERPEVGSISGCTATLVGPRLVITAAHCVDYGTRSTPGRYGTFEIRRSSGDSQRYTIERYVSFGGSVGPDDVALLRLASAVPGSVATAAGIASTDPSRGTPMTIYGYGCQARGTRGTWAKQKITTSFGATTTNLCPGDSGGPTVLGSGAVLRVNSGYYVGSGVDIFGSVPRVHDRLQRTAASWGDSFGSGMPSDPPPPPPDAGMSEDPPPPPPPPMGDGPCASSTCEEATGKAGCGWCDATGRGIRVGAYGEALESCNSGYRLNPEDCGGAARSTCGPWSGISSFTCRQGRTQFVRCFEGSTAEFLTCPSGYTCQPGSTRLMCYR
ncbi:MAG: S1 family peptidase [Sandaracinus sp.]|nr:S1 family peptidase [Sandaracinus sp.]MCB9636093.1 S1 family peptidase [Sandaracinus sp.]